MVSTTDLSGATSPNSLRRHHPTLARCLVVLLLGLAELVTATALMKVDAIGRAFPAALPVPPRVGSCLLVHDMAVTRLPCDRAHNAEVVQPFDAGALDPADFVRLTTIPFGDQYQTCDGAAERYLAADDGSAADTGWVLVPPPITSRLIAAPATERTADGGWSACVVGRPDMATFAGSLGGPPGTGRASVLGFCLALHGIGAADCGRPHRVEILAYLRPVGAVAGRRQDLENRCAAVASTRTQAADPTYRGALRVVVAPLPTTSVSGSEPAGDTHTGTHTEAGGAVSDGTLFCSLQTTGTTVLTGMLTGTLIGLGDRALPLG